jgi:hypothetical protein
MLHENHCRVVQCQQLAISRRQFSVIAPFSLERLSYHDANPQHARVIPLVVGHPFDAALLHAILSCNPLKLYQEAVAGDKVFIADCIAINNVSDVCIPRAGWGATLNIALCLDRTHISESLAGFARGRGKDGRRLTAQSGWLLVLPRWQG